ncbi:MAG: cyclase family protein [Acidimicrobiia bacterium]
MALPDEFHELAARVRNWGRWGSEDELGTLNLIDAEARRRGVACVRDGRAFSLAIPLSEDGPQLGFVPGRTNPVHTMFQVNAPMSGDPGAQCWNDDAISMGVQACTHWDGLAHASYEGHIWNGYPADTVTSAGASKCGIHRVGTLVSRGVLLDVARLHGVDALDGGYALTRADLDGACEQARVTIEPGDVVLLRTGHMRRFLAGDKLTYATTAAGPSLQTVEWFHSKDVAAVATDNLIFEVFPCERDDMFLPVHYLHLVDMGLTQGQNFDLEALGADCAEDGRSTFLLTASPEPIVNGVGAMVNPVALK